MNNYEQFIDSNKIYFENRLAEIPDKYEVKVMGFVDLSAKEAFQSVIDKTDTYYLPYCLYLINFGMGVTQDKDFCMSAYQSILVDEHSYKKNALYGLYECIL